MEENHKASSSQAEPHKLVQTYAEDMAEVLRSNTSGGQIKKIIHSEEEEEARRKNVSPEARRNKIFTAGGVLLLFCSFLFLFFFLSNREAPRISVEPQFTPLVFTDRERILDITDLKKSAIAEAIVQTVNTSAVKPGGVEGIYLTFNKNLVGLRQLLTLIESNFVPGDTSIVNDQFLLGVVKRDQNTIQNNGFFVLLKTRSMIDIFPALKAWESKLFADMHEFFQIPLSAETKYLLTKNFEDGIIENKNARILYADVPEITQETNRETKAAQPPERDIVLMYVFADDNSVIITDTESVVREIMLRLASSEVGK